ncbi:hypothetical protein [Neisseria sp.]|uniref:hypothetical protein n=1 Tax=Neisseria sp. TaxID=192066 RepID=UPI0035A05801
MMKWLKIFFAVLIALWLISKLAWHFKPEWFLADGVKPEDVQAESPPNPLAQSLNNALVAGKSVMDVQAYEREYADTGTLPLDFPRIESENDYVSADLKIGFLVGKGHFLHANETENGRRVSVAYHFHQNDVLEVSVTQTEGAERLIAVYRYLDGKPFSAQNTLLRPDGADNYTAVAVRTDIWQADGSLWRSVGDRSNALPSAADAYRTALQRQQSAAKAKHRQKRIRSTQQQANQAAANRSNYVQLNDLAAVMPAGMKHNSLVVGYDAQGLPEKIYYSYDNGRKRQSFEYYLDNGQVYKARSSTVALAADGVTADTSADHREQNWTLENGQIIHEKFGSNGLPPDQPLQLDKLQTETARLAAAVR